MAIPRTLMGSNQTPSVSPDLLRRTAEPGSLQSSFNATGSSPAPVSPRQLTNPGLQFQAGDVLTAGGGAREFRFGEKGFEDAARSIQTMLASPEGNLTTNQRRDLQNFQRAFGGQERVGVQQFQDFVKDSAAFQKRVSQASNQARSIVEKGGREFFVGDRRIGRSDFDRAEVTNALLEQNLSPEDFARVKQERMANAAPKIAELQQELASLEAQGPGKAIGRQRQAAVDFDHAKRVNRIRKHINVLTFGEAGLETFDEEQRGQELGQQFKREKSARRLSEGKITPEQAAARDAAVAAEQAFIANPTEENRALSQAANQASIEAGGLAVTPGEAPRSFTTVVARGEGLDSSIQDALTGFDAKDQNLLISQLTGGSEEARAFALDKLGLPADTPVAGAPEPGAVSSVVGGGDEAAATTPPTPEQITEQATQAARDAEQEKTTKERADKALAKVDIASIVKQSGIDDPAVLSGMEAQFNLLKDGTATLVDILSSGTEQFGDDITAATTAFTESLDKIVTDIYKPMLEQNKKFKKALDESIDSSQTTQEEQAELANKRNRRTLETAAERSRILNDENIRAKEEKNKLDRARRETFAGLTGGFGSSAQLTNLKMASDADEAAVASMRQLAALSSKEFADKLTDEEQRHLLEIRSISDSADEKKLNNLREFNNQANAINNNIALTDKQKTAQLLDLAGKKADADKALVETIANAIHDQTKLFTGIIAQGIQDDYQREQDAIANNLAERKFRASLGDGGGSTSQKLQDYINLQRSINPNITDEELLVKGANRFSDKEIGELEDIINVERVTQGGFAEEVGGEPLFVRNVTREEAEGSLSPLARIGSGVAGFFNKEEGARQRRELTTKKQKELQEQARREASARTKRTIRVPLEPTSLDKAVINDIAITALAKLNQEGEERTLDEIITSMTTSGERSKVVKEAERLRAL